MSRRLEAELCYAEMKTKIGIKAMKDYRDVRINVDGENILTISSNHLCGVDNINDYKDDIKELALSLLSFIGEPSEVGEKKLEVRKMNLIEEFNRFYTTLECKSFEDQKKINDWIAEKMKASGICKKNSNSF